jgi:DNA processing protein
MTRHKLTKLLGRELSELEKKFAPEMVFVSGDISLIKNCPRVSVIGSRTASAEGLKRAAMLTKRLVQSKVTIVSGLAEGIDTVAHNTAMYAYGKTIGVLGTPINQFYPIKNKALQIEMMQSQLVISQFPIGQLVKRHNFPIRNRLMALISHATVIIEAKEQSGTLTQGWECLRLGRPLFILESNFKNPDISWPAKMQSFGARLLTKNNLNELLFAARKTI